MISKGPLGPLSQLGKDFQLVLWLTAENSYWNNVQLWLTAENKVLNNYRTTRMHEIMDTIVSAGGYSQIGEQLADLYSADAAAAAEYLTTKRAELETA